MRARPRPLLPRLGTVGAVVGTAVGTAVGVVGAAAAVVGGGVLGGALVGCVPDFGEPLVPIKIGVLNPLTGDLDNLGPGWERSALLAAEQINASGGLFGGRELQLVFKDTEGSVTKARDQSGELLEEGVAAV